MSIRKAVIALVIGLGAVLARGVPLRAEGAADLFNPQVVQRIDLDLHSADWAQLRADFQTNTYSPSDFSWNGMKVYNTGIRSHGIASRSGQKPALKVDFNHYSSGQTFLGLKAIILKNLAQDASGIHEGVAMWFMSRFGIPAPHEAFATLFVNGEYAGLYGLVEYIDQTMVSRAFSDEDGSQNDVYLYEFKKAAEWGLNYLGSDLDPYRPFFDPKTHESSSVETLYRPIENLVRVINESAPEDLSAKVGPLIDLDELVRYVALQNFISEQDGFTGRWGTNNFYLFRPKGKDQHRVIAWDEDLSFADPDYPVTAFLDTNALFQKLMQVPEYRALYFTTLRDAADSAELGASQSTVGALESEIRRQLDLTVEPMLADPVRLWTDGEVERERNLMKAFATRRIRFVQCEVGRITGVRPCN